MFNSGSSLGSPGLGFARATGPNAFTSHEISNFVTLNWVGSGSPPRLFRDVLDSTFGASIENQHVDSFSGFETPPGSWTPLEKEVSTRPAVVDEIPLCFAFLQYEAGYNAKLYYGEVFGRSNPATAFCMVEVVDSMAITTKDDPQNAPATFKPLWCSLGMTTQQFNTGMDIKVPVIAYGVQVKNDPTVVASGEVKVASLPSASIAEPPIGLGGYDWVYLNPPNGGVYNNGIQPVDGTGT